MNFEYDNPKAYEQKYAGSAQVKKEDDEFVRVAVELLDMDDDVVDLGCGTGLGFQLLHDKFRGNYFGVDLSGEMIKECRTRYAKEPRAYFGQSDCYKYMDELSYWRGRVVHRSCISLYALDLMNPKIVRLISNAFDGACVFLVFNEPWMPGSASLWAGAKEEYDKQARANSEEVRRQLREHGFTLTRFCDQDYYYLVTRKKQGVYHG